MNFEKKLVILTGKTGKGTALIERNGIGTFITLNAFSLPDLNVGEYALGVKTATSVFRREVGSLGRIKSRFALPEEDYTSLHLVLFRTSDEEVVLYGSADAPKLWEANIMDGLRRARLEKKTSDDFKEIASSSGEFDYGQKTVGDYFLEIDPTRYRDNAVSEENYFEFEYSHSGSPLSPSELTRKYLGTRYGGKPLSAPMPQPAPEPKKVTETEKIVETVAPKEQKREEVSLKKASSYTVEEAVSAVKTDACFYASVKNEMDRLFASCERFEPLEKALPDTRWVKVDYDTSGRYYVVGLIGSAPDCIAYGVPGKFGESPAALGGADFVPVNELKSAEGFWVMFQSAQTGKEIKNQETA